MYNMTVTYNDGFVKSERCDDMCAILRAIEIYYSDGDFLNVIVTNTHGDIIIKINKE